METFSLEDNPIYIIGILEEFLEFFPTHNTTVDQIESEIDLAKIELNKLKTIDSDNILLKNKVDTHIRYLSNMVKEKL